MTCSVLMARNWSLFNLLMHQEVHSSERDGCSRHSQLWANVIPWHVIRASSGDSIKCWEIPVPLLMSSSERTDSDEAWDQNNNMWIFTQLHVQLTATRSPSLRLPGSTVPDWKPSLQKTVYSLNCSREMGKKQREEKVTHWLPAPGGHLHSMELVFCYMTSSSDSTNTGANYFTPHKS